MNLSVTASRDLSRLSRGYLIAFIGTILWSSSAIFIRYVSDQYSLPPLVIAFWRDILVVASLGTAFLAARRSWFKAPAGSLPFLGLYGLILSLFNATWVVSVTLNGAAVSTVLAYSSAGITALVAWRIFGERLDTIKIIAVVSSLMGCAFVSGAIDPAAWRLNPAGVLTGLLSGVAFAIYSLMGKAASHRAINPWTTVLYTFAFAAVFLLCYNLVLGRLPNAPVPGVFEVQRSWPLWGVMLALAIVPTIGGYGLYTVSLTYLPASIANLIATMEPAFTAIQAYLLLGERLTLPQLFGSVLILGGVIAIRLSEGK